MSTAVWIATAVVNRRMEERIELRTHMQASSYTGTLQWLLFSILQSSCHKTGHLIFGELNFSATKGGQAISNLEFVGGSGHGCQIVMYERKDIRVGSECMRGDRWKFQRNISLSDFGGGAREVKGPILQSTSFPRFRPLTSRERLDFSLISSRSEQMIISLSIDI
jgi:hypothetical protein